MYYTDNMLLPEYMDPLIITAAPYGPQYLPGDCDIPVSWDEQLQAAVDCYEAGAAMLHFHVRNPATGHGSTDFDQFNYMIERIRKAVPDLIIQVGGSISFAPKTEDAKAKWLDLGAVANQSLDDIPLVDGAGHEIRLDAVSAQSLEMFEVELR